MQKNAGGGGGGWQRQKLQETGEFVFCNKDCDIVYFPGRGQVGELRRMSDGALLSSGLMPIVNRHPCPPPQLQLHCNVRQKQEDGSNPDSERTVCSSATACDLQHRHSSPQSVSSLSRFHQHSQTTTTPAVLHPILRVGETRNKLLGHLVPPKVSRHESLSNVMKVQVCDSNVQTVCSLQLDKHPLVFLYEDRHLVDSSNRPLFIEWRGVSRSSSSESRGSTQQTSSDPAVLQGKFYFRGAVNSQPTRLLRSMLRLAGFPPHLWETPKTNNNKKRRRSMISPSESHQRRDVAAPDDEEEVDDDSGCGQPSMGARLRAYDCMTTRIGPENTLYRLRDVFPFNTRRSLLPQKPAKRDAQHLHPASSSASVRDDTLLQDSRREASLLLLSRRSAATVDVALPTTLASPVDVPPTTPSLSFKPTLVPASTDTSHRETPISSVSPTPACSAVGNGIVSCQTKGGGGDTVGAQIPFQGRQ